MNIEGVDAWSKLDEEEALSSSHFNLGMSIRNLWGLWQEDSDLHKYFKEKYGIWHADDMSGIILTSFHRELNHKEWNVKKQVDFYKKYWKHMI